MDLLKRFLQKNRERQLKIHCIGDAMIDEYYDVDVNRISPEFPMPIMWSSDDIPVRKPGGAANVISQLKHFNVDPMLICWANNQATEVFNNHGIICKSPFGMCCTLPIKKRFLHNGIQVVRHDIEPALCGLDEHIIDFATSSVRTIVDESPKPDVVILSDYGKGFFSSEEYKILDFYQGTTSIVDPKHRPLTKWKGCSIFKPNSKEATELTGRKLWKEQAKHLQNELECESVVITCGGEKVAGVWRDEFFCYKPNRSVTVESVIGAGDCFVAFLAMAVGHGFSVPEAAEIAWEAGANYVMNRKNRPVTPSELSPDGLVEPIDLQNRDFKLAFTNGCFDIIHEGHIKTLEFAKSKADKLVVALNSDESVRRLKGESRPIKTLDQRIAVMRALKAVDFVVSFDEDNPSAIIQAIGPDVLVKGADYKESEIVGADMVSEVYRAPLVKNVSTTKIIESLRDQQ